MRWRSPYGDDARQKTIGQSWKPRIRLCRWISAAIPESWRSAAGGTGSFSAIGEDQRGYRPSKNLEQFRGLLRFVDDDPAANGTQLTEAINDHVPAKPSNIRFTRKKKRRMATRERDQRQRTAFLKLRELRRRRSGLRRWSEIVDDTEDYLWLDCSKGGFIRANWGIERSASRRCRWTVRVIAFAPITFTNRGWLKHGWSVSGAG